MPVCSISMCSNTLHMSNMDTRSSLTWLSASTKTIIPCHASSLLQNGLPIVASMNQLLTHA